MGARSSLLMAHGDGFAWSLLDAAPDATVIVAVRADFYGHCTAFPELAARFDAGVDVIVLTGAGEKFFCAGANIEELSALDGPDGGYDKIHRLAFEPGSGQRIRHLRPKDGRGWCALGVRRRAGVPGDLRVRLDADRHDDEIGDEPGAVFEQNGLDGFLAEDRLGVGLRQHLDAALFDGAPPEHVSALGQRVRLPMRAGQRSLNLSNAVAVAVFEAWRQNGFAGSVDAGGVGSSAGAAPAV